MCVCVCVCEETTWEIKVVLLEKGETIVIVETSGRGIFSIFFRDKFAIECRRDLARIRFSPQRSNLKWQIGFFEFLKFVK